MSTHEPNRDVDQATRREATVEVRWLPGVDPRAVEVAVRDGEATVSGTVAHDGLRRAVVQAVARVAGVRSVVDRLEIRPPDLGQREAELARAVVEAFGRHRPG